MLYAQEDCLGQIQAPDQVNYVSIYILVNSDISHKCQL